MNKKELYQQKHLLSSNGWEVSKASRYNAGSERVAHAVCKALVGHYVVHELGLRASFEVVHPERGEVDVLVWGAEGEPYCVECESNVQDDVIESKVQRYVYGTPLREVYVIPVDEMPENTLEAFKWIAEQLP